MRKAFVILLSLILAFITTVSIAADKPEESKKDKHIESGEGGGSNRKDGKKDGEDMDQKGPKGGEGGGEGKKRKVDEK
ncbi:MAG: hypothetical protein F9K48_03335 [Candidatus Brocadia sp.]|nr:MAG: hypothetical protein F9K48_03335 [Candidatus Brocadia sp.]